MSTKTDASTATPPYRTVIGLEVHVQLLTRTKLFCGCSTEFGLPPNSATCPVCTGLPGSLPVMNRRAFELALKAATALNCEIASFTKWDRKNYYYPDLPKNYQISQYDLPFSHDGWLEVTTPAGSKRIRIIRVHLEEDAGKMLHDESGGHKDSLVDLNRTGTPLLEIVSHPDIETPEEAKAYLEEIRLLLRELKVSDCEMQEGSLRCDANVNIHVPVDGTVVATPIVEIKNLNSFRAVERALKYETQRQFDEYTGKVGSVWEIDRTPKAGPLGNPVFKVREKKDGRLVDVSKATAGWVEERGVTIMQRRKEEASDYRYFPEPDLVPVRVSAEWLQQVRADMGELPAVLRDRLQKQYGLSEYDAEVITRAGRAFARYFEDVARIGGDAKEASNWLTNEVQQTLNERKQTIEEFPLSSEALGRLIQHVKQTGLNKQRAREVFAHMLEHGGSAEQAAEKLGFKVMADEGQLRELVHKAIAANPKAVADYKNGKTKAADAIKGAVMRETKGMAKTELVQQILLEELAKA
jgi:aspartyl-tRNA(Asn)/glutamyl-tRNA(Gln) amidotransferase subunit B